MFVQKIKRSIFNLLVLAQLVAPLPAIASSDLSGTRPSAANEMLAASGNLLVESLNRYGDKINMKWVNGGFRAESNGEYSFDLKAFSVIREYAKQVFFTQYGLSKDGDASTLNAGLGFYHLLANNIMIGGNAFYDARTGTEGILNPFGEGVHKRFSVGGTIMTSQAGMFFNVYRGLSDSIARYKVSDGYDFGINGLVPGYESVNLGVTHYNFNEETQGNKFKVEYKPNSLFTFGVEQDQSDNPSSSLYVETKYEFNKPLEEQLQSTARVSGDVWSKRYNEVERDNKISLELAVVDFTMATPTSVPHGATVYLKPLAIGGGDGELSFEEVVADDDVTVDTDAGTVTSSKVAEVDVKVTRAALGEYNEATVTVTVIFTEKIVTLVDDAADKGLLTSEQGEDEGFGVDLTKAIVMVGTGGVSYAIKSDEEEEDESKMASSPMVNHTGKAVPASHPLGASVTEKGLVTATGVGTVGVVVSQKGDSNYEASVLDVYVTFSKSSKGIEVEVPKSVEWGKTVDLKPLISGGGEGKLSFKIKEGAENTIDANVTQDGGIVTAVGAGTIEVTVKREEDSNYEASTQNVTVNFDRKTEQLTGLTKTRVGVINYEYTIAGISGAGDEASDLSYVVKGTNPSNMGTVNVNPTTGVISGVDKEGKVTVTVTHAQDEDYNRVYGDVTVDYIDSPLEITVTDQEVLNSQVWDSEVDFNLADYITGGGTGTLTFAKAETNDNTKNIGITEDGKIRANEPGVLTVLVSRGKSDDFGPSSKEVTVTFGLQTRVIDTVTKPATVKWGEPSSFERPVELEFNYTIDDEKNTVKGATAELTEIEDGPIYGVQVDAKGAGDVIVTMSIDEDTNYKKYIQYVTVSFDKKDSTIDEIPVPESVEWGTEAQIIGVTGTGGQMFEYTINKEETKIDAEVELTTGIVKSKEPGSVHVTVTHKANEDYTAYSKDVEVPFGLASLDFTIDTPDAVLARADVDLSKLVIALPEGVEKGTLRYEIAGVNSNSAVLSGSNLTADIAGTVKIKVIREEDGKYKVSSNFVDVTFDFNGLVSPATILGDAQFISVSTPLKITAIEKKAGYKEITILEIIKQVGYNNNNQTWEISSDIHKTWSRNTSSDLNKLREEMRGDSFPNCSIANKIRRDYTAFSDLDQIVYVKEGETCSFDVTFYRKGNYKGKTEKVEFRADSAQRSKSQAQVETNQNLSGSEETVGTGENTFLIQTLERFSNPGNQEVRYSDTHSVLSVQSGGLPWPAAEVTDSFVADLGRDKNCIAVSDNNVPKVYVRRDFKDKCKFSVIFLENSQYFQANYEMELKSPDYMEIERQESVGSKVATVGDDHNSVAEYSGKDYVNGVYMVQLDDLPNASMKRIKPYHIFDYIVSGPDVESAAGGEAYSWAGDDTTTMPGKINGMQKCLFGTEMGSSAKVIFIKEGETCNLDITFPTTNNHKGKTQRITLIATGKDYLLNNESTIGNSLYKASISESDTFNYVSMSNLEQKNGFFVATNGQTANNVNERKSVTYSGVDVSTDSGGIPWPHGFDINGVDTNCVISERSQDINFYVKKGTSCAIAVTFPADDGHFAKTETLTLSADTDDD